MQVVLLLAALLPLALAANVRNGALGSSSNYVHVNAFNDVSAPEITDMACTNTLVDVTSGSVGYQCVITAVDLFAPASGVAGASMQFQSPSGKQKAFGGCGGFSNGRSTCSGSFPQYAETGIWYLETANITDRANNLRVYRHGDANYLQQSYTVVGKSDVWAPRINYFAILNTTVTAFSSGGQNPSWSHTPFTILLNCSDNAPADVRSEKTDCADTLVYFTPPAGTSLTGGSYEVEVPTGNTNLFVDGVWRQRAFVTTDSGFLGRGYPSGAWKVSRIRTRDNLGNWFEYGAGELASDSTFTGQQTVTVNQASYPDRTPPVVTAFALFPDRLDLVDKSGADRYCVNVTLQGDLTIPGGGTFRVQARTWVMIDGPSSFTMGPCDGTDTGGSASGSSLNGCYWEIQQPGPFTLLRFCGTPPDNFQARPGTYSVTGVVADDGMSLEPDNQLAPYPLRYANQALYGYCNRFDAGTNDDLSRPGICYDENKPSSASSLVASMGLAAVLALLVLFH